jgi:hypothetical protein
MRSRRLDTDFEFAHGAKHLAGNTVRGAKVRGSFYVVMARLVPAILVSGALYALPHPGLRGRVGWGRDKPGDDEPIATSFAPSYAQHGPPQ